MNSVIGTFGPTRGAALVKRFGCPMPSQPVAATRLAARSMQAPGVRSKVRTAPNLKVEYLSAI